MGTKIKKTPTQISVENGIKVVKLAIRKNLSLSEASRQHEFGRNYVSDIKANILSNYRRKNVSRELYVTFRDLIKKYNS